MQEMSSRLSMCKDTEPSRTHRLQTEATLPDNRLEQPKMNQTVYICLPETGMAKHPCNLKKQLWACAGIEELDQALGSSRDSNHLSGLCKASFGNFGHTPYNCNSGANKHCGLIKQESVNGMMPQADSQ